MADTVAGTRRMREKSTLYLPKEPAEDSKHYQYRLKRATFFNAVDRTLNGLVGMVFRNGVLAVTRRGLEKHMRHAPSPQRHKQSANVPALPRGGRRGLELRKCAG